MKTLSQIITAPLMAFLFLALLPPKQQARTIEAESAQLQNVALGKRATQSSTSGGATASRAVDGNTNGNWNGNSVTHTQGQNDPWWEVDLGGLFDISEVKIFNRTDCCRERLTNFRILYSERPINASSPQFVGFQPSSSLAVRSFKGSAKKVRYVRISVRGRAFLHLAEVQVFGVRSRTSVAAGSGNLEQQCYNAIQGKVAWNRAGSKSWGAANVRNLCKGTTNVANTISCFKNEIKAHNNWSRGINACKANPTVARAAAAAGPATKPTTTASNVTEVKFYSRNSLTLAQARSIAAQNGWQLATPAQVTAAWRSRGLNAFAYGRTSDGRFCVPIQQNNGSFRRGANCGITGGNQGFLYVKRSASAVSAANVAEVGFYPKTNVTMAQARSLAARYGWRLATPAQVAAAWKHKGLHAYAYGRTSDGRFCVPIQQFMGNFRKGANCGVTGGNQGFLFVTKTLSSNLRSGRIVVNTTAPPVASQITGPPRTIGTKYAGRFLHLVWNRSVQHPAQRMFGLGDAVMLRKAATLMLSTQRRSTSNASVNSLLDSVSRDAAARYRFAPYLLKVAFDALATPRPDSGQLAFRKNFAAYMGLWRFEHSLATLNRWNSYKKENERSQFDPNRYKHGPTFANILPMRPPDVSRFLASQPNSLFLGNKGQGAIKMLIEPAAAASLPAYRNSGLGRIGADMDAVAAGIGTGTTITTSAATLGLVTTTVFVQGGSILKTATGGLFAAIMKAGTISAKASGLSLGAAGGIGVAIAIALAVVIGIAIAKQAIADEMDRRLRREFDIGFNPVNVNALVNDRNVSKRGINRTAVFGYLLKMLIADPAERGSLTLARPDPRTVRPGLPKPGVVQVVHKGGYVSDVTLSYLDRNRRPVRIVRNGRPIHQVDRFDIPGDATQVRLSIVMYTGLAWQPKVSLINRVLRKNELYNMCFTTVGTTIVGRGLRQGPCQQ